MFEPLLNEEDPVSKIHLFMAEHEFPDELAATELRDREAHTQLLSLISRLLAMKAR